MVKCNKCGGKCYVDMTFTENKAYEVFCLSCGKRTFVGTHHPQFRIFDTFVKKANGIVKW